MEKNVMLILVGHRKEAAPRVQQILTECGSSIKTRLGLNQEYSETHTDSGLIFLELNGKEKEHNTLASELNAIPGVQAKLVSLAV